MNAIISQLTESDYRRNSNTHPEDWSGIDLSSLSEDQYVRLNIKTANSEEPERMLVVIKGYISTYYNIEDGTVYSVLNQTPVTGNLTKDELNAKVYELQNKIMTPNFAAMMISIITNAANSDQALGPKTQAAADWIDNLWATKYYAALGTGDGPYSFSEDTSELAYGFLEVRQEIEAS